MPQISEITAASWATSGSATTGTTGFAAISGLTHVGSSDVPTGSGANGYLTGAYETNVSFTINATNTFFQGGNTHAWLRFHVRAVRDRSDSLQTNDQYPGNNSANRAISIVASGTKYFLAFRSRNQPYSSGTLPYIEGLYFATFGGSEDLVETRFGHIGLIDDGDTGGWHELWFHVYSNGASSEVEVYVNGVLISRRTGVDLSVSFANTNFPVTLHAVDGITWQIAGPFSAWQGTDVAIRPIYDAQPTTAHVSKAFGVNQSNNSHGSFWTSAGTATVTKTAYASGGTHPFRSRYVVSGSSTQTANFASVDDVGTLPYNEKGWATIAFPMIYLPGGATGSFRIRNSADDADIVKIDYNGTAFVQGATTLETLSNANRYALFVHFHSDGRCKYSIHDLSNTAGSTQYWFSGSLNDWTPAAIGKIKQEVVRGSADCEIDGVYVARWLDLMGMDSYTHSICNALSPDMACGSSHIGGRVSEMGGATFVPGGPNVMHWVDHPRTFFHIVGRTGKDLDNFWTNCVQHMDDSYGVRLTLVNGGSVNGFGAVTTDANQATFLAGLEVDYRAIVSKMISMGNKLHLTTQIRNEQDTTASNLTAIQIEAINKANVMYREVAEDFQRDGYITFSDVASNVALHTSLFTSGDDIHLDLDGDTEYALSMYSDAQSIEPRFGGNARKRRLTL